MLPFIIPSWAVGIAVIMIAISVARALSGRSPRGRRGHLESESEIADLQQNLEAMQHRVAELEERVDFTERLLAKQRDADRLGA